MIQGKILAEAFAIYVHIVYINIYLTNTFLQYFDMAVNNKLQSPNTYCSFHYHSPSLQKDLLGSLEHWQWSVFLWTPCPFHMAQRILSSPTIEKSRTRL